MHQLTIRHIAPAFILLLDYSNYFKGNFLIFVMIILSIILAIMGVLLVGFMLWISHES